jgi:hypothetical protein
MPKIDFTFVRSAASVVVMPCIMCSAPLLRHLEYTPPRARPIDREPAGVRLRSWGAITLTDDDRRRVVLAVEQRTQLVVVFPVESPVGQSAGEVARWRRSTSINKVLYAWMGGRGPVHSERGSDVIARRNRFGPWAGDAIKQCKEGVRLTRRALEAALDDLWRRRAPGVEKCPFRAQLLCLPAYLQDDARSRRGCRLRGRG